MTPRYPSRVKEYIAVCSRGGSDSTLSCRCQSVQVRKNDKQQQDVEKRLACGDRKKFVLFNTFKVNTKIV